MITPREGSSLYYSLLWTPPSEKDAYLSRLTLINAIAGSLDDVQEPSVAEKKIHWWHEELERLAKSTPRHPACVENRPQIGGNQAAIRHCLSILSSAASARYTQSETDNDAAKLLMSSYKARLALLSDALHNGDRQMLTNSSVQSDSLALAFAMHENLYRLRHLLHQGFAVFSDETYDRHSISPTSFASNGSEPLIKDAITRGLSNFESAFANDSVKTTFRQPSLLPIWRLAKLRAAQLHLWQRQGTKLIAERATLTPLRKLYIAWRHRRS